MKFLNKLLVATGLAGGVYTLYQFFHDQEIDKRLTEIDHNLPKPPPPAVTPLAEPILILGDLLQPKQGRPYLIALRVFPPASWLATLSSVKRTAESHGLTNVIVTKERPGAWPAPVSPPADYYLSGVFDGPQALSQMGMQRNQAGGQVVAVEVWEL